MKFLTFKKLGLVLAVLLTPNSPAFAATCIATINTVRIQPEGTVGLELTISGAAADLTVCSLVSNFPVNQGTSSSPDNKSIAPVTCQAILANLMTAKASGKTLYFNTVSQNCTFTGGNPPVPYPYVFDFK